MTLRTPYVLKDAIKELEDNPLGHAYVLIGADERIKELVQNNYGDIPEAVFLQFFYSNIRYHLWAHIGADASLRVSDPKTENIITSIKCGLENLVNSIEKEDKALRYDALVKMVFSYLNELNEDDLIGARS